MNWFEHDQQSVIPDSDFTVRMYYTFEWTGQRTYTMGSGCEIVKTQRVTEDCDFKCQDFICTLL